MTPQRRKGAEPDGGTAQRHPAHENSGAAEDAGARPPDRLRRARVTARNAGGKPRVDRKSPAGAVHDPAQGSSDADRVTGHDRDSGANGVDHDDRDAGEERPGSPGADAVTPDQNEVALTGRLSAAPTERILRSGSRLTAFRLIVRRPHVAAPAIGATGEDVPKAPRRNTVDVVDCAVWDAALTAALAGVAPGDRIAVRGALRRRFASSGGPPTSWFTVEVAAIEPVRE